LLQFFLREREKKAVAASFFELYARFASWLFCTCYTLCPAPAPDPPPLYTRCHLLPAFCLLPLSLLLFAVCFGFHFVRLLSAKQTACCCVVLLGVAVVVVTVVVGTLWWPFPLTDTHAHTHTHTHKHALSHLLRSHVSFVNEFHFVSVRFVSFRSLWDLRGEHFDSTCCTLAHSLSLARFFFRCLGIHNGLLDRFVSFQFDFSDTQRTSDKFFVNFSFVILLLHCATWNSFK